MEGEKEYNANRLSPFPMIPYFNHSRASSHVHYSEVWTDHLEQRPLSGGRSRGGPVGCSRMKADEKEGRL